MHGASFSRIGRVEDHSGEITVILILLPVAAFVALLWFFGMYFTVITRSALFETSKRIVQLICVVSFTVLCRGRGIAAFPQ